MRELLAKHAIIRDSADKFGRTPHSRAARRGHSDVEKLMLEKCDEYGIAVRDKDVDIGTAPAADQEGRVCCDICTSRILNANIHDHCRVFIHGDFDIYRECIESGAYCLDDSHELVKRTVKGSKFVEVTD